MGCESRLLWACLGCHSPLCCVAVVPLSNSPSHRERVGRVVKSALRPSAPDGPGALCHLECVIDIYIYIFSGGGEERLLRI